MDYLNTLDYSIIGIYFAILVALGFWLQKKASASLEDYCVGGCTLPWWALGISGMASWLDVAGTMVIVSFLFMMGPRGLFVEFRGGVGLIMPFILLWAGKWIRRSKCLTPAEWMIFRFGDGPGGRFAQFAAALGTIMSTIAMLAYLIKGIGLFLSTFLPYTPFQCALVLVAIATVYTMVSGFYGVVYTDMFQSVVIMAAVITVVILSTIKISACQDFAALTAEVTGQTQWTATSPGTNVYTPVGYEMYKNLLMFSIFYLLKNVFFGMGFPGDPKYFGARNDRECGTLSFLWTSLMTFRWPLMIGLAILGIFLVKDLFPDQAMIAQTADLIKQAHPTVSHAEWPTLISNIASTPEAYSNIAPEVQETLGEMWKRKLMMVSYYGTVNPERIMPSVLLFCIPQGLRGLMLIALIAASMSTFDSSVNVAAGVMTRDLYQKYARPSASNKELIGMTWLFVAVIVLCGFLFAYRLKNINDIWGWITMCLGATALAPGFLRFYWWRINGGGFAVGTIVGMFVAITQRIFHDYLMCVDTVIKPTMWKILNIGPESTPLFHQFCTSERVWGIMNDDRWMFPIVMGISMIATIIGTYMTKPTDDAVLEDFYTKTRPFGVWGHLKKTLSPDERKSMTREHTFDICALPFVMIWQVTMYLLPMQLMVRNFKAFGFTLPIFIGSLVGMYFLWYKQLPAGDAE